MLSMLFYYNDNFNSHAEIRYKNVWEYFEGLYARGEFEYKTSYDFWKRTGREGRELVDKVNQHLKSNNLVSKTNNIDVLNIKEVIDKYGVNNKEILWENLKPYDNHLSQLFSRIEKLQVENDKLGSINTLLENQLKEQQKKVDKLQVLLFSLFTYSNKDNELYNLINTGQTKSKIIDLALAKTFENPIAFFEEMIRKPLNLQNFNEASLDKNNLYNFPTSIKQKNEYDL